MLNPRWGQQRLSGRALALLGLLAFFLFLPGRASTPPFDRDEPRYMEATAQMLESGNFVDVRFQDKPRYLQPAGIYWLEAASVAATGTLKSRAVWAYRLPSLLAMTAAVVLTAWMGSTLFGATAGLGAGLLLMVSVLVTAENRMGTIDSTLLLSVLLAQAGLLRALCDREAERPTPLSTALLYWGAIGCGLMLKGPVILIPSLATPLCLAAVERNFTLWRRLRPAWGWLVSLAILLPWCIAIGVVSHGEFFRRAVGTNFLGKVASGQQAHGLPPGYHLLVFLIAFWPGSFFAAAALPAVWKSRKTLPVKYLLCWIIPHWVVFEAIATKLPHYVLPTYPAIAILTAGMLAQGTPVWAGWPRAVWARLALGAYGVLWTIAGVALALGWSRAAVETGACGLSRSTHSGGREPAAHRPVCGLYLPVRAAQGRADQCSLCHAALYRAVSGGGAAPAKHLAGSAPDRTGRGASALCADRSLVRFIFRAEPCVPNGR
ncbi:glycosyl transferase [Acetobacter malorum]|uniref:Glycosyl transferase n=1 Tax=Acetobacter malorum TaxID=178901 RepID=A0A177GFT0_9PROT|nr:glycosyl transferase [Acetobacter malorum]